MALRTSWQRVRSGLWLGVLGALVTLAGTPCAAEGYSEDAVKAAFLARFARYVDWPPSSAEIPQFTIAVLGDDGVANELQRLLPGSLVGQQPALLHKIRRPAEIGDAQMLYVGPGRGSELRVVVALLTSRPVLLVTDDEHGLDVGAAVNFLLVDQRVRFEVSVLAAERAGLKMSAELLSVAARVQGSRRHSESSCAAQAAAVGHPSSCNHSIAQGYRGDDPPRPLRSQATPAAPPVDRVDRDSGRASP